MTVATRNMGTLVTVIMPFMMLKQLAAETRNV